MALSYVLEIETKITSEILLSMINHQFSINNNELIIIVDEVEISDIELTESLFNFRPNLSVMFRINSLNNNHYYLKLIAQISLFVLERISGNAVLLFNEEIMIIQRINEKLIFNQQEWQMLSGIDLNHIMLKAIA
jgi:hypothetical protein